MASHSRPPPPPNPPKSQPGRSASASFPPRRPSPTEPAAPPRADSSARRTAEANTNRSGSHGSLKSRTGFLDRSRKMKQQIPDARCQIKREKGRRGIGNFFCSSLPVSYNYYFSVVVDSKWVRFCKYPLGTYFLYEMNEKVSRNFKRRRFDRLHQ